LETPFLFDEFYLLRLKNEDCIGSISVYKGKGGVEGYAYSLSSQLLRLGHEVHIFAHRYSVNTPSIASDIDNKLTFHHVPAITFWSPLKYWTFAINAPKVINKSGKFDIVHGLTHTLFQDIYRVGITDCP